MSKILHLLAAGGTGGIEVLMKNFYLNSCQENIFLFFFRGGEIANFLKEQGANVIILNNKNTLKKLFIALRICSTNGVVSIVSHHSSPAIRIASILIKLIFSKIKFVYYAHSDPVDMVDTGNKFKNAISFIIEFISIKYADDVIAISEYVKNRLVDFLKIKSNDNRIKVLYNGIPYQDFFEKKHETSCNANKTYTKLIYVGRLIKQKGIENVLYVFSKLPVRYSLKIVGEGEYRIELEKLARQLGVQDRVIFTGNRADVSSLLKEADIFIHLPNWQEGFGISVIEAMASGKIVICGNSGALPEIIDDGLNGLIVDSHDYETISNIIQNIEIYQPDRMINNAKNKSKMYSIDLYSKALDKIIG